MSYAVTHTVHLTMLNDAAGAPDNNPPAIQFFQAARHGRSPAPPRIGHCLDDGGIRLRLARRSGFRFDLAFRRDRGGFGMATLIAASRPRIRLVLASLGLVLCAIFAGRISYGAGFAILASCGLAAALPPGPGGGSGLSQG